MEDIAAVSSPMLLTKDVVVRNSAMDDDERFRVPEFILQGGSKNYRLSMFLSMLDSLETLDDFSVWEDRSSPNCIIGVTGTIREIQSLPLLKNAYHDIPVHILGWGLASVNKFRRDKERLVDGERDIAFHKLKSHPGSLINSEICVRIHDALMSIFGYFFIGVPDSNSDKRVNDNKKANCQLRSVLYSLAALLFVFLGFLFWGWGYGWWKGIYNYSEGCRGEMLADISCLVGVCFWIAGIMFLSRIA